MPLIKRVINKAAVMLDKWLDVDKERPFEMASTKLVDKIFTKLADEVEKEMTTRKVMKDGNFLRLVETTRKALIYLANHDPYYDKWLRRAFKVVITECSKSPDFYEDFFAETETLMDEKSLAKIVDLKRSIENLKIPQMPSTVESWEIFYRQSQTEIFKLKKQLVMILYLRNTKELSRID